MIIYKAGLTLRTILGLTLALAISCARPQPRFDHERAYADLLRQTQFGPRIPGSSAHTQCATWLKETLSRHCDTVIEQPFRGVVLGATDSARMVNLIGRFQPGESKRVLIAAHWDTRPFADVDPDSANHRRPLDGANDGASGVAILLELARALDSLAPPCGVDLVCFDGEDMGDYGASPGNWCQGSTYFAARSPSQYKWAIVIDMVGAKDMVLPMEGYSLRLRPELVDRVWTLAEKLGETEFTRTVGGEIFDDHMPLLMRGIPAIDIIGHGYPYWHTIEDTADKCSAESLGSVGRVLLSLVWEE